jgi:hypothetical protein
MGGRGEDPAGAPALSGSVIERSDAVIPSR